MNFFKKQQSRPGLQRSQSRWRFGTRSSRNFDKRKINVGQRPFTTIQIDNNEQTDIASEPQIEFVGNQIKSSKYTIFTFLPR